MNQQFQKGFSTMREIHRNILDIMFHNVNTDYIWINMTDAWLCTGVCKLSQIVLIKKNQTAPNPSRMSRQLRIELEACPVINNVQFLSNIFNLWSRINIPDPIFSFPHPKKIVSKH